MRRSLSTVVAALALTVLVGCTGGDERSSSDSAGDEGGAGGGGVVSGPAAPGDPEAAPSDPADADADRQVVTTASASLAVDDPADAAQRVSELVESAGGRVDERTEQAAGEDGTEGVVADLVVRVPADALTGLLADLEELGEVEHLSVHRSDETATVVDLDARISALRTSVTRLQSLMDDAATTEALLSAEEALSERQEKLESLLSQRALLADQVALSTLSVHLQAPGVAPSGGPDGFLEGLGTGWRSLVSTLGAAVVVLGVVLPWLVVAGLVAAAVLIPIRLSRRPAAVEAPEPSQE